MAPRDGVRRRTRVRGRRGALSVAVLSLLIVGAAGLPIAAQLGVLPVAQTFEVAHGLDLPSVNVSVVVNDTAPGYDPDTLVVTAEENATFQLYNNGSTVHTFTVVNASDVAIPCTPSTTPAQVDNNLTHFGTLVNATIAPGAYLNWSYTFNASGTFEFLSAVPYQCQVGFNGFLHVLPAGSQSQQYLWLNATGDLTFTPSTVTAEAGVPITFFVGVQGSLSHTFVIDGVSNDTAISPGGNLPSSFGDPPPAPSAAFPVSLNLVNPGTTYTSAPTIFKSGIYWFVCTVPGHFSSGMWGKLYVSIPLSLPSSTPSITNVLQYGYLAVVAAIIGLGAFLVLMGMNEPVSVQPGSGNPPPPAHGH